MDYRAITDKDWLVEERLNARKSVTAKNKNADAQ